MLEHTNGNRAAAVEPRVPADPNHDRKLSMVSLPDGFSLLILESNMILALDVEDMLLRKGATRVDVVCTCEEAHLSLETTRYHAAVIDLNLPRETIGSVAMRLTELGIPFAFSASHGDRVLLPASYPGAVLINTPCNETYLMSALGRLLGPSSSL